MAAANTQTLASTRQYTELNAGTLRSTGAYDEHTPILTCTIHAKQILVLQCVNFFGYAKLDDMELEYFSRILVTIRDTRRTSEISDCKLGGGGVLVVFI
jgi:hypothetical protein